MTMSERPMYGCFNHKKMKKTRLYFLFFVLAQLLQAQSNVVSQEGTDRKGLAKLFLSNSVADRDTVYFSANARFNLGNGSFAPFLSTYNQYDRHSTAPNSQSFWGTIHKYTDEEALFDYGYGAELDINLSNTEKRLFSNEWYVQGKVRFLNLYAGMHSLRHGNEDPELSSGGLIFSQNSRPLPAITVQTNDWVDVPFTHGYVSVQGGLSHGWFLESTETKHTLLHYKFAGIRLGGSFPVNLNFTLQHACQWGGVSSQYGSAAVNWENYMKIFLGESGGSDSPDTEQYNALGNHIISKNLGLDLKLESLKLSLYWQNIYEDGPVLKMARAYNIRDGLWGASLRLHKYKPLSGLCLEYLCTTDQSGPWHDLDGVIYGGTDNYYNNGVYPNGWTFHGMTLGNPFLTSPVYNSDGSVSIENNKVQLYYGSGMGTIGAYSYRLTFAYSKNYGSPNDNYSACKNQYSGLLDVSRALPFLKNTSASLGFAGDLGEMYGHNFQLMLGVTYMGLFSY
jgi:hypothetical protein